MAEPEARGQKPQTNFFRTEGEYWPRAYEGTVVRLRHAKGMRTLVLLLSQPGQRVPAAALLVDVDGWCRGTAANAEQSRVTLTKRIKAALKKIQEHHPSLGHHLTTCIKTGHFCGGGAQ